MPSTYSDLKIELMATGEQNTTWGNISNVNWEAMEEAVSGSTDIVFSDANVTLTLVDSNASQPARNMRLRLAGAVTAARELIVPAVRKLFMIQNELTFPITVKMATGTGVAVPAGKKMLVYVGDANVVPATDSFPGSAISGFTPNYMAKGAGDGSLVSSTRISDDGTTVFLGGNTNVTGGITTTGVVNAANLNVLRNGRLTIEADSGATPASLIYNANNDISFFLNSAVRMYVGGNGSVGIGTTAPGHMLHVTGNIGANQFYGDAGGLTGSAPISVNYANSANTANSATNATNATNANYANGAGYATNAGNADTVDGVHASQLMSRQTGVWQNSDDGVARFLWIASANSYYKSAAGHVFRNNADADTFTIDSGGSFVAVGNGTVNGSFTSVGNIYCHNNVGAFSDAKLKTNLEIIPDALDKVCALNGYTYDRIDHPEWGRQVGLIAQEVQKVLPEAVMDHDDTLTLAYGNMIGLLVGAIKELREEVAQLKGAAQ